MRHEASKESLMSDDIAENILLVLKALTAKVNDLDKRLGAYEAALAKANDARDRTRDALLAELRSLAT
jgi:hypothetical protein